MAGIDSSTIIIIVVICFIFLFLLLIGGSRMRPLVIFGLFFALLFVVLSSCQSGAVPRLPGAGQGSISFQEIFERRGEQQDELNVLRTENLDVDDDGEDEWVVLYQYDPTVQRNWNSAPLKAAIYDALPCDPPQIYSWELATPDNDYMGEGPQVNAYMANILPSSDKYYALNELVIHGTGPNSNTLSLWRYHDQSDLFPCTPVNPQEQYFDLLGFWRADLVTLTVNEPESEQGQPTSIVTTYRRTAFERSQLAIRSIYQPTSESGPANFIGSNGRTVPPLEQGVAFIYGMPALPTDSPYPEKAVATMLLGLGESDDAFLARFFSETPLDAVDENEVPPWKRALGNALGVEYEEIERVIIRSIAYQPDRNAELRHEQRTVTTTVIPISKQWGPMAAREITWVVQGFNVANPEDCEWRIVSLPNVITPGTGYAPPQNALALTHD